MLGISTTLTIYTDLCVVRGFPGGSDGKASFYNAGDLGLIPGSGRFPGEGNGNPLQYSCLEWMEELGVHGFAKSRRRLSDFTSLSLCVVRVESLQTICPQFL